MKIIFIILAVALSLVASVTFAGGNHAHVHGHEQEVNEALVGEPGDPNKVSRTIVLEMTFKRFKPSRIDVKKGETIKFVLKNISNKEHEIMIGTMKELEAHAKEMRINSHTAHLDPNQVTVSPGETEKLVWKFTRAGTVPFACPRHGHFKSMRGEIIVAAK